MGLIDSLGGLSPSALGEGIEQGANLLGESLMWGGGAGNPIVMQGMMNSYLQKTAEKEQRRHMMGQFIFNAYQAGDISWEEANPALKKLGFGDLPRITDSSQQYGGVYNNLAKMQADRMAAQQQPGGIRPSALHPAQTTPQPEPPVAEPFERLSPPDEAYGTNRPPPKIDEMSRIKDASGGETVTYGDGSKVYIDPSGKKVGLGPPGVAAEIESAMTQEEKAYNQEARAFLARPKLSYQDVADAALKSGMRGSKFKTFMKEQAPQIVKDDEEQRAARMKQMQTNEELARKRLEEPKTLNVTEYNPKFPNDPDKAESVTYRFDPQHKRPGRRNPEDDDYVQISRGPKVPGIQNKIDMFERTAEKESVEAVIGKDAMTSYRASVRKLESLKIMEQKNREGILGGFGAGARQWFVNAFAPLATEDQLKALANSKEYQTMASQLALEVLSSKALGSGNSITENDRRFVSDMVPKAEYDIHAREQLIKLFRHYTEYEIEYWNAAEDWVAEHKTIFGFRKNAPKFKEYTSTPGASETAPAKDYRDLLFGPGAKP